ncbi:HAD family hydrolase [Tessaracoccus sp. MC1865]|uniref:HAD family hydrolase n=1 Tax=Tessaracoccus sp. MC1865 TaxID=2760310 RepID=UPI001603CC76|nr:HAD family hydrolase [Tessaracoccus sp. MC1865]MBB1484136.1 HAD family hydrolase [Tessaracoccus sp. MC1865]QTO37163.1 HAD family hydrolase [Tessaracoccus sp. MC1865]
MTRAVLFDLDGTLADTVPLIAEYIAGALNAHGIECVPRDVYPLIGRPIEFAMGELHTFADDPERMNRIIVEYRDALHLAVNAAGSKLVLPGVREMLEDLRLAGYRIGVVTAKGTGSAIHLLDITELSHLIDALVTTEDVEHGKPAPDSALLGLERLEVQAEGTWYVGDAVSDMTMAIAAGMRPLGITTGAATREELLAGGAEVVVDSAAEVTALLTTDR